MTGEKYRLAIKTKKICHLMCNIALLKERLSETAKNLNGISRKCFKYQAYIAEITLARQFAFLNGKPVSINFA